VDPGNIFHGSGFINRVGVQPNPLPVTEGDSPPLDSPFFADAEMFFTLADAIWSVALFIFLPNNMKIGHRRPVSLEYELIRIEHPQYLCPCVSLNIPNPLENISIPPTSHPQYPSFLMPGSLSQIPLYPTIGYQMISCPISPGSARDTLFSRKTNPNAVKHTQSNGKSTYHGQNIPGVTSV